MPIYKNIQLQILQCSLGGRPGKKSERAGIRETSHFFAKKLLMPALERSGAKHGPSPNVVEEFCNSYCSSFRINIG